MRILHVYKDYSPILGGIENHIKTLAELETDIATAGLHVTVDLASASTRGDGVLLEHLAANLIGNAVRHNIPQGSVAVRTGVTGDTAVLQVTNSGPIIAPEHVPALMEPFRRATPDRTGHPQGAGLGLSIVHAVVAAHRGTIDVRAQPDGGLDVQVRLPLHPLPDYPTAKREGA